MNNSKPIIALACDFADFRGEGILARNFIKYFFKNKVINIYTKDGKYIFSKNSFSSNFIEKKKINHCFLYRYLTPFLCIIKIWYFHIKGFTTIYLNFLPLWNIFLFSLLPSKTILGPITGSFQYNKKLNISYFIRKNIFPLFYKISIFFLKKKKKIIFARDFFYNLLPNEIKKKCIFNFQISSYFFLNKLKNFKFNKKIIDVLIYYRVHENKNTFDLKKTIKKFQSHNINIHICGEHLNITGVTNHGLLSRNKIINLLLKTKYVLSSDENLFSYFVLDALRSGSRILYIPKKNYIFKKNNYLFISANNKLNKIFKGNFYKKKNEVYYKKKIISFCKSL